MPTRRSGWRYRVDGTSSGRALAWSRYLVRAKIPIITTEAVLWEWMNALADPAVRRTAAEGYRRCHGDPQVEVVPFGGEAIDSAVSLYEARGDKSWSLTDCFSFVVMRQRQLADALSADRHFERSGFRTALGQDPPNA